MITIRETFEASLLLGLVLAVLDRDRDARLRRVIWVGLVAAALASVTLGFALFETVGDLHGRARELVEGMLMWTAAAVLTYVLWWMSGRARASSHALREDARAAVSAGSALALLGLVFVTVFREGAETVLYLGAASATTPVGAIGEGAAVGLVAGVSGGFAVSPSRPASLLPAR